MNIRIKLAAVSGTILLILAVGLYLTISLLDPWYNTRADTTNVSSVRINIDPIGTRGINRITITDAHEVVLAEFEAQAGSAHQAILSGSIPKPAPLASSLSNQQIALCCALIVSAVVALMTFLGRVLLNPIQRVSTFIKTISAANNLSLRVPSTGSQAVAGLEDAVNIILDTTEFSYLNMMTARYEAESANRGTSLFVAKVSHELRTPIHGITGMLRILLKQEQSEGKRHYIQMAQDAANALLNTINEILDFSKMQNGELSLEKAPFRLSETIRSTIEQLIPRFEEKPEVVLCWDIHPEVPEYVIGDSARIRNILVNLLGNAFKFTEKGSVTLEVSPASSNQGEKRVKFSVTDTGIGIAKDKLQWVFDPFTTADERSARLYTGTGLGLPIVRQIAERMGGKVGVESTLGAGSTFTVEVPLQTADTSKRLNNEFWNITPKRVAILSTRGARLHVITQGLERFGCDVASFRSEQSGDIDNLLNTVDSFDIIHIIKNPEAAIDDFAPIIQAASLYNKHLIMGLLTSDLMSTEHFTHSENLFETLQPTSALDLLLMASGRLVPTTTVKTQDDEQESVNQKLNILIADDAKTNRIILKNLLEEAGHSVEVVENGQQLLERISTFTLSGDGRGARYDLVLTDIQMPIMDGITAAQNFRQLESKASNSRKLPIVAVTSYALPEECSKMLASGIDHIITKPISPKRLSRLISQITCEVERDDETRSSCQSDSDILNELCRTASTLAQRIRTTTQEAVSENTAAPLITIDISDVFERSGNSLCRTGLILNGFLDSYQELLAELKSISSASPDFGALRRITHSLKGLLLDVGAKDAVPFAASLEQQARKSGPISDAALNNLYEAVSGTAKIIQEIVTALPSVEIFSALPLADDMLSLH
jgi:signal transduction histidine kinase/CheY-like chemotaxis protein